MPTTGVKAQSKDRSQSFLSERGLSFHAWVSFYAARQPQKPAEMDVYVMLIQPINLFVRHFLHATLIQALKKHPGN